MSFHFVRSCAHFLEEELQGKIEAETKFADEKALIRSKIDNLLVRLDELTDS